MIAKEKTLTNTRARTGVRLKTIALPAEHGGWGFLFEPVALGLLLAPSVAGFYLALSAVGFFLARHPLTLLMLSRTRRSPRVALSIRFAALYLIIGTASLLAAFSFSAHSFLLPLLIALPLVLVQLLHDFTGRRRVLLSEVAGVIAISSLAAALALAGGWRSAASFALWMIMVARALPAILYVRACLARVHGRSARTLPIWIAHVAALAVIVALAREALAPRLAVLAMMILLIRAVVGLRKSPHVTPKQLGFTEIAFGAMTVLAVVCGKIFVL